MAGAEFAELAQPSWRGPVARDRFREVPLRYLGYANEVGEAFRHVVAVRWVHMSYLVASSYVTAHALQQGYRARGSHHTHREARCEDEMSPSGAVVETLVWQGLASVVIPGYTINRVCALSHLLLVRQRTLRHQLGSPVLRRWTVTAVGLGCIPLIIQPIDSLVDGFMDFLGRPLLKKLFS